MRETRATTALAAALLMVCSAAVSAQEVRPPAEIGAGYGGLIVNQPEGDYTVGPTQPGVHLRLTIPYTPRFSFEALTTISSRTASPALHVTSGLYIFQVNQRLGSATGERFHAFLTYGGAGYYARLHQEATTVPRSNGTSSTIDDYSFNYTDPPFFAVIGGGVQRELGRKAAFRADVQMVTLLWAPAGVRLSAGISIPLEDYGAMASRR